MHDVVRLPVAARRRSAHGLPGLRNHHPGLAPLCSGDGQGVALTIESP